MPTRIPFAAGPACRNPLLFGALLIVTGELMFASMGASIRFAAQSLPNEMVVFASLYGWALWQEVVEWSTISGALLIALSGVSAARARGDRAVAIA